MQFTVRVSAEDRLAFAAAWLRRIAAPVLLLASVATSPNSAHAGPLHYALDIQQSNVSAKATLLVVSSVTAHFPVVEGATDLEPAALDRTAIAVTLDAQSLTTEDESICEQLKGADFFDVAQFPLITFRGARMTMTGERTAKVFGELTARGKTRSVTLDATFDKPPAEANGVDPISISATTKINRDSFGMVTLHGIVGRKVLIRIEAILRPMLS